MKPSGLLLAASVIGAVAIGGAVTGSTHATWRDSAALAPATIEAGFLDVALNATPTPVPALEPNSSVTVKVSVSTSGAGRNLRSLTTVRANASAAPVTMDVAVSTADASCDSPDLAWLQGWDGSDVDLTEQPSMPGGSTACLRITRGDVDVAGELVELMLEASTQQYRASVPGGWSDAAQISLPIPAPAKDTSVPEGAPTIDSFTCQASGSSLEFRWSATGAVGYRLFVDHNSGTYRVLPTDGPPEALSAASTYTMSDITGGGSSIAYRLEAVNGDSTASRTITLVKSKGEWGCPQ